MILIIFGIFVFIFIIVGIVFMLLEDKKGKKEGELSNLKKGILILFVLILGYLIYVVVVRLFNVFGWFVLLL